jgi:hypothetical protein
LRTWAYLSIELLMARSTKEDSVATPEITVKLQLEDLVMQLTAPVT